MAEDQYVPQFCRIHWSWLWVLSAATGGIALMLLALYLSWWVRLRNGRGFAIYLYLATSVAFLVIWMLSHYIQPDRLKNVASIVLMVWWGIAFVLRKELNAHFGNEFEISAWYTALLSVFYLDYCLWAISDSPYPSRSL